MMKHTSVLLQECIDSLVIKPNGIYVDGTLGRAGHSSEILKRIPNGHLYCFDKDQQAILESEGRLAAIGSNFTIIHAGFKNLKSELQNRGVDEIDGLLLDLGVSSPQFDEASRGFSYRYDAPLDMRMDQSQPLSAYEVVNTYEFNELMRIFYRYGEDSFAKQVARKIEQARSVKPIETTFELVDIIKSAYPAKVLNSKGHPAKKIFQAIRIEVNDELSELETVLEDALAMLKIGGRVAVISFHSLEDRIVKETFVRMSSQPKIDKRIPLLPDQLEEAPYRLVTKKPILAGEAELKENNRSHSAKLRVIERVK
ncbi:16S rRNA (cytosine(1402)-N(4))-methyltransferase RsmH [Dielma fastidiosa]|uniref:Ribosomal RNA small subunit methyltransferase H n=1 Tax=Dielma fastidiosa TaxID=1034346 RepID=A0AB35UJ85_9FIRM|nr:16S rRNA (cytosine(1402)-N(4))-methyltransferase RsmH [Dielma fastidiosa]MDY5166791.1 16S rRNA (cytosine(1402)-N(4))-methyltransferase RsmH [Dielma fastidiosa]